MRDAREGKTTLEPKSAQWEGRGFGDKKGSGERKFREKSEVSTKRGERIG